MLCCVAFAAQIDGQAQDPQRARQLDELLSQLEVGDPAQAASALDRLIPLFIELDREVAAGAAVEAQTAFPYVVAVLNLFSLEPRPEGMRTAVATLESAAVVARKFLGPDFTAEVEYHLAHELRAGGRVADAEQRLTTVIPELEDAIGNKPLLYIEFAECARTRGDRKDALARIDLASAACEVGQDVRGPLRQRTFEGYIVGVNAQILIDLGLADRAAPLVAREAELLAVGSSPGEHAAYLLHRCALLSATDQHELLVGELHAVLASVEAAQFPVSARAELQYFLGAALAEQVHVQPGLAADARANLKLALAETTLSARSRWTAYALLADLDRRDGDFVTAAQQLASVRASLAANGSELGADGAWLTALEARLALDSGADTSTRERLLAELERDFARFLGEWSAVPDRGEGIGFLLYSERRAILVELVRLELDVLGHARGAAVALERLVGAQALGSLARYFGGEPVTFAQARRELCGARTGVLEFLPGPEHSFVFAFDDQHLVCSELAASRTWELDRRDWVALLSHPPLAGENLESRRKSIASIGARLAKALLPPETRELLRAWDEVAIVGIDLLGCTPFDVLPLDEHTTLGYALATSYLPSLTVGSRLLQRAGPDLAPALELTVLAAPTDPAETDELPGTWTPIAWNADHERELRRVYGADGVRVFSGDAASLSALRAWSGSPRGGVVEIVAHGFYQPASEPPAGIALAPCAASNGLVHAADLAGLKLGPLVVLAVCGAGRTPLRSGDDGVSNLGGAFLKAGPQCVVLSPVDLEQGATEALLDEFHARLADGESPARSMRSARRKLIDGERYADPFYNSMLQVVGLGSRPLVAPRAAAAQSGEAAMRWPLLAVIAAVVTAILLAWRARRRAR